MHFQRLEDFSNYASCIKFFGKPIIPSLVTAKIREDICSQRSFAVEKEIEMLKRRESYLLHPKKTKEIHHMVADHLSTSSISNDFLPCSGDAQETSSALHSCINKLMSSPSTDIRSFENSIHMSMTKIPASDICSTVHTGVIVCPNVKSRKHPEFTRSMESKSSSIHVPPNGFCFHMANPECSLCQTGHLHGPFPIAGVPYINSPAERICSVSDDEQCSVAEETEFESLVTVVSGKKFSAQDTDNESNFTCLTQSTDLEKYMDCSIEYSSPDDGASLTKSQMCNQLNISSRSDDASSETLVNTESELTPCASTLPELNGYPGDDNFDNSHATRKNSSSTTFMSPDLQQRAHSVDSYMKIVKTCARNLFMRKSQSEPSHSDMSNFSNNLWPATSSCDDGCAKPANLKLEVCADSAKMSGDSIHLQGTDKELFCDNIQDPSTKEKKIFKKRHIRTNSYTLEEPSSALILAHADCNCTDDSETLMSPHSCTNEKLITPTLNPAFKKEKINIVLPPTPDRDKYFPLLSSSTYYQNHDESELDTPVVDTKETEAFTDDNSVSNKTNLEDNNKTEGEKSNSNVTESVNTIDDTASLSNTVADDEVHLEQVEISLEVEKKDVSSNGVDAMQPNEQNIVMSTSQVKPKDDDLQSYLNEIILEIQEKQQIRVQKLLDEQNKQWLELQEEFTEQENLLCAKLNLVGISSTKGNMLENKLPLLRSDKESVESTPSDYNMCPDNKSLYDVNIRNKDISENNITTKNSNTSDISLLKTSENKANKEKALGTENLLNASLKHSNISRYSEDIQTNENTANNLRSFHSADSSNISSSFSGDTFERSHNINSLSSRSVSSLDCHNSDFFYDAVNRCSSVQSDSIAMSVPCSLSPHSINNASMQTVHYRPTMSASSVLFTNVAYDNKENSAHEKHEILKPESGYGADYLLKDRVCDASSKLLAGAYSAKKSPGSNLENYEPFNLEMQPLNNETNDGHIDQTLVPPKELKNNNANHSTHPYSCLDSLSLKEREKSIQNLSTCQHFSQRKNFEESSVFTSLGDCTSMALPIITNPAAIRYLEENLTCNDDEFKQPVANFENCLFSGATNLSSREKFAKDTGASTHQHCYSVQNNFGINSIPDSNLTSYQVTNSKRDFTIGSSITRSHSSMSRKVLSKHPSSSTTKSQSDSSISQSIHKIPMNAVPTSTQAKAQKQIISSSLTNLKRKQSKDFIRDPNLLKKFEKLPAFVKGYLTRRLFKTERVQGLIKTLQDTAILIGKLGEELNMKGDAVSEHDVDFHRQLIVQLMTTFHSIYDIFCTISVKERMNIIYESRIFEQKKKSAERSKDSPVTAMAEKASATAPSKQSKLSAATVKALERKRRSTIDNRTYTVEDLKGCRMRIHSSTSSKSHSSSPSRIYKSSLGLPLKRKMTTARKTQHWK